MTPAEMKERILSTFELTTEMVVEAFKGTGLKAARLGDYIRYITSDGISASALGAVAYYLGYKNDVEAFDFWRDNGFPRISYGLGWEGNPCPSSGNIPYHQEAHDTFWVCFRAGLVGENFNPHSWEESRMNQYIAGEGEYGLPYKEQRARRETNNKVQIGETVRVSNSLWSNHFVPVGVEFPVAKLLTYRETGIPLDGIKSVFDEHGHEINVMEFERIEVGA